MSWKEGMDWLVRDEQEGLFDLLFAIVQNILFLALAALLLWPAGRATMAFSFAKGYGLFWIALAVTAAALVLLRRIFRVDLHSHPDAYVNSALAVSCFLQAGWSAFAALSVQGFAASATVWTAVILYLVGAVSCYVAFNVVSLFYEGHIYKLVNLLLALVSFVVFSVWPAAGRAVYGWFFELF
jgi:hypothetical protein